MRYRVKRINSASSSCRLFLQLLAVAVLAAACSDEPYPEAQFTIALPAPLLSDQDACADKNPLRNAYFGDTHVHTAISSDAWMFDVRVMPEDAHRYAFGGSLTLPDSSGEQTRVVKQQRPLDFVAITDHAEFLGESFLCASEESIIYSSKYCEKYRQGRGRSFQLARHIFSPIGFRADDACGVDGQQCRDAARNYWQMTIDAAEKWNDSSPDCERTAFIAYEYSSFRSGSNLHRNVIFKNNVVPQLPISHIEEPLEWNLWAQLKKLCKDSGTGCDVLAIPHNSNISNGRMFNVDYYGAATVEQQAERARLRMEIEPVIEIYQHKGDSECVDGIGGVLNSSDELCNFEKFENFSIVERWSKDRNNVEQHCPDQGKWAHHRFNLGPMCYSPANFARYALIEGLAEEQRIGVNPFKFGISAATDTHNGIAGGTEEKTYPGHLGTGDETPVKRASWNADIEGNASNSPGGLFGIWATENNRNALFEAMQAKEVFGTSGTRIKPRLFGGWDYPDNLCQQSGWLQTAYANGVAMGGDLGAAGSAAPRFVAMAIADPGTQQQPGTPLQRLQIIKGFINADGEREQRIYDIAGDANNGASVDLQSCKTSGAGFAQLCTVWQDPDFNAEQSAVYYLRAVENPSCRYDAWQCLELNGEDRPADCDINATMKPKVIQERAWSSPIWYSAAKTKQKARLRQTQSGR